MIIGISAEIGSGKDTFCEMFKKHSTKKWENKKFAGKLKQIVALITGCKVEDLESEDFKNSYLPEIWDKKILKAIVGVDNEISDDDIEFTETKRFTYRELLQVFGTELMRNGFHDQVHVLSLFADYKLEKIGHYPEYATTENGGRIAVAMNEILQYPNWLITDMRFVNEFDAVKKNDGVNIKVIRYMEPENWISSKYFNQIEFTESGLPVLQVPTWNKISKLQMVEFLLINQHLIKNPSTDKNFLKLIHQSEVDLNNHYKEGKFDFIIHNDSTIEHFESQVIDFIKTVEKRNGI